MLKRDIIDLKKTLDDISDKNKDIFYNKSLN